MDFVFIFCFAFFKERNLAKKRNDLMISLVLQQERRVIQVTLLKSVLCVGFDAKLLVAFF